MSVCTFKRLPFICFADDGARTLGPMAVQIVSTPIHNGCPAHCPLHAAGGQENKPSKIAIFDFTFLFFQRVSFTACPRSCCCCCGCSIDVSWDKAKPKAKYGEMSCSCFSVALRGIAAYKSFYFQYGIIGVCLDWMTRVGNAFVVVSPVVSRLRFLRR